MSLLHPLLLWLVPLAIALPIAAHLYLRVRTQPLVLPSVMFFLRIDPKMQARRRLREYLLLLLRILFLLTLLLALTRPVSTGWGPQARRAAVVVIDNSASMRRAAALGDSCLEQARRCGHALIDSLRDGDAGALLATAPDPMLAPRLAALAEPAVLHQVLDSVQPSDAASALNTTIEQALALLSAGASPERELHLVTDLDANEWSRSALDAAQLAGIRVVIHHIQPGEAATGSVLIEPPVAAPGRILAGRPHPFRIALSAAANTSVDLAIRGSHGAEAIHRVRTNESGTANLVLDVVAPEAGEQWLRVEPSGQAAAAATAAYRALPRAWVDMRDLDAPLLELALSPAGDGRLSGLVPRHLDANAPIDPNTAAMLIPLAALRLDQHPVHAWLEQGGIAMAFPAERDPRLVERYGLRCERSAMLAPPQAVLAADAAAKLLPALSDEAGIVDFPGWQIARHVPLQLDAAWAIIAASDSGAPILAQRRVGAGRLVIWGVPFDQDWTSLPLRGYALALVQSLVLGPDGDQDASRKLIAGARPSAPSASNLLRLDALGGGELAWHGAAADLPRLVHTDVYRLDDGTSRHLVAVNADPGERTGQQAPRDAVPSLAGVSYRSLSFATERSTREQLDAWRSGGDLATPLALLGLLLLAAEAWVGAWRAVVARRAQAASGLAAAGAVMWHPGLQPAASAVVAMLCLLGLWWLWHRLRERCTSRDAAILLAPKVILAALLFLIAADPYLRSESTEAPQGHVLALIDTSSSMDVIDDGARSRLDRAWTRVQELREHLPDGLNLEVRPITDQIGDPISQLPALGTSIRSGDLTSGLVGLASLAATSHAILVISDGGDEAPRLASATETPLHVLGIGADGQAWADLAVVEVEAPPSAEQGVTFTIRGELRARRGTLSDEVLKAVPLFLEKLDDAQQWHPLQTSSVDLRGGRVRSELELREEQPGRHRYRLRLASNADELTAANNQREFAVEIGRERVRVLYYGERIALGYKYLRAELARDPGLHFTALLRTYGDRYQLAGSTGEADEALSGGFPSTAAALSGFQVIILAAAPDSAWPVSAQQALAEWVAQGGALVWFDCGEALNAEGYRSSPLHALRPWQLGASAFNQAGAYSMAIPRAASSDPLLDGVAAGFADAALHSLVVGLEAKPDATVLLAASLDGQAVPVVASRPWRQGQVLAVATDSLWRLARSDEQQAAAYGRFWRQAVRSLSGHDQRLGHLRLRWDREHYRPGDEALLEVHVLDVPTGLGTTLSATVTTPSGDSQQLSVRPASVGTGHVIRVPFATAGEHALALDLRLGDGRREHHDALIHVAPRLAEGARLDVDHDALDALAISGGGSYIREDDRLAWRRLIDQLGTGETVRSDAPLVSGRLWPLILACLVLCAEWLMRRKVGMP
ncbi:MAG: VWA domain-containing protein [Planctomycetota bacterium]|jgi:hypothetical protein|nr:VWA domain-containing protein [Planctomycetota bacterium]